MGVLVTTEHTSQWREGRGAETHVDGNTHPRASALTMKAWPATQCPHLTNKLKQVTTVHSTSKTSERERERHTHTHTHTQTEIDRDRNRETERGGREAGERDTDRPDRKSVV